MGVVSRRWVWLVGVGGIYGCGCKEVYRFPHTTFPYSSCIYSFLQQHPYFLFIYKNALTNVSLLKYKEDKIDKNPPTITSEIKQYYKNTSGHQ